MDPSTSPEASQATPESYLTLEYEIHRSDLFAQDLTIIFRHRLLMLFAAILLVPVFWSTLNSPELKGGPMIFRLITLAVSIAGFLIFFFLCQMLWACMHVFLRKHRGVLGRHELEIASEGLIERTEVNEGLHKWSGICRVISGRKYLYIYVTESNMHMVPRRYFSADRLLAFETELKNRIAAAYT